MNGDGQVVDLNFAECLVELVPCFDLNVGSDELTHPDSHGCGNGSGSWQLTNPKLQIKTTNDFCEHLKLFQEICQIVRRWKRSQNVELKGILIDTFVYKCFQTDSVYFDKDDQEFDYFSATKKIFAYLANISEFTKSLMDLSNHDEINVPSVSFIKKAKKALKKMNEDDEETLWENLQELFGDGFPDYPTTSTFNNTEEFIGDKFPVHLTNHLQIDCTVSQDGFRNFPLLEFWKSITGFLLKNLLVFILKATM